jgi:hypothetical protein
VIATVGERFAEALLAKDWNSVRAVLHPAVDFRGMTPSQQWEAKTPDDLVDHVLTRWFEPSDDVYEVLGISTGQIVDHQRVVYRFRVRNPDGDYVCEQTAYYDTDDAKITKLRICAAGFSRQMVAAEDGWIASDSSFVRYAHSVAYRRSSGLLTLPRVRSRLPNPDAVVVSFGGQRS